MSIEQCGFGIDSKISVLKIGEKTFRGTFKSKEDAEEHAKNLGGIVENFYVAIKTTKPDTREVLEWDKEEGYSVWI